MTTLSLDGAWEFRAAGSAPLPAGVERARSWLPASVPGTVHTDLLACGLIPDPFFGANEHACRWVEMQRWVYRKVFHLPAAFLERRRIVLAAEGLDTYARVALNGARLGETSNMFMAHRFNAKPHLRPGRNVLTIAFDSPVARSKAAERREGALRVALEPHRVYVRKAQYSFGWDWGPKLTTSGIWKNIRLEAAASGAIADPFVKVVAVNAREAVVEVRASIGLTGKGPARLEAVIEGHGRTVRAGCPARRGGARLRLRVPSPRLWWPNGYGGQPLYTLRLLLRRGGHAVDARELTFGIRTVRLVREKDGEGETFILEINGVRIYCKGADWIPADSFLPRIPASKYARLLSMAKDAHMNMIRVWGGGIYENDEFYECCDRLGLMVWQDFMYACGEYPDGGRFAAAARAEAEAAVRRLRNHPSIAVWCGNNECEWLFCTENPAKTADDMRGAKIFRDILPGVCAREDGTRPYWRSSPFGRGFPNDESNGNHHQWSVWSFWKDYREYEDDNARFVTEFGFQAPPNRATFDEATLPRDRTPQSAVVEHHNKQTEGTERLFRFQAAHFRVGRSWDDFIYYGQLVQAEALKCAVEHWRRRKFLTAGSLFWQLNDCWPVSSWAVVDSALRPKAGYYFAKKFFAPVLVSFRRIPAGAGGAAGHQNGMPARELWLTNDLLEPFKAEITLTLRTFDGTILRRRERSARIPGNVSVRLMDSLKLPPFDPAESYLHAVVKRGGTIIAENREFFAEPKHLDLPEPEISVKIRRGGRGRVIVELKAKRFARSVRVEAADAAMEDNYFDLDPGKPKRMTLETALPLSALRKRLGLRSVR